MRLYFLRHGVAEDAAPGQSDASRKLTDAGRAKMRREAAYLAGLNLKLDAVFSSPYPRALETAQIVQDICRFSPVIQDSRIASGAFGLGALQAILSENPALSSVLFVGHEPDLSVIVRRLCGGVIDMKKGGLAYVQADSPEPDRGVLCWLLPRRRHARGGGINRIGAIFVEFFSVSPIQQESRRDQENQQTTGEKRLPQSAPSNLIQEDFA